ncbi:xylulokinase [Pseudaestuariivita rosea]|uniref:xylulokinase n=1 Tax=Pseudaestuariivita rosea TaxID=2763263 RepID=UPI001ABBCF1E
MYLGIDIGTSAVKTVLITDAGKVQRTASAPLSISHPKSGFSEQDPEDWWRATLKTIHSVMQDGADVKAIGLSGQMHGAVLLDQDQTVIRPAILWNDGRSTAQCAQIEAKNPDAAQIAGVRPMPGLTAPKLMWVKENEPETYRIIRYVLLPKDYIGFRLHGEMVTDPSDAAGTFWLNQKAQAWSDELCNLTATDPDWLPTIKDGAAIAGYLTKNAALETGLPPGIPIAAGAGDAAAGAISVGAIKPQTGFISLGTSGQMFVATDHFKPAPHKGLHTFAHCTGGGWFQMAAMLNGARPLSWFSEVTKCPIPTLLTEAAENQNPNSPIFLPYLTGERTPHNNPDIRAGFFGLENNTTQSDMTRAVIDAIAYSFADATDVVSSVVNIPSPLLAIGGGAQSDLVLQTIADATGLSLGRGDDSQIGPAFGAACLAAVSHDAVILGTIAPPPRITVNFKPNQRQCDRHKQRIERYRLLYQTLKNI